MPLDMNKYPNLPCFIERVASHPERLQYIYFDIILMLRAVARLEPYLKAFDYCSTGTHEDDARTLQTLSKVLDIAKKVGRFDESVLFRGETANVSCCKSCYNRSRGHENYRSLKRNLKLTSGMLVASWIV